MSSYFPPVTKEDLKPLYRAVSQLDDNALLGVVLKAVLMAAGLVVLFICLLFWLLASFMPVSLASVFGGTAGLVASVSLFLPIAVIIATLMLESISRAVEARYYPDLPPPTGVSVWTNLWEGVVLAALLTILSFLSLFASLILPVFLGAIVGWAISGWALGRGLFMAVAMRRRSRAAALQVFAAKRTAIILYGVALALLMTIPLVNLFATVLSVAIMVHIAEGGLTRRQQSLYDGPTSY